MSPDPVEDLHQSEIENPPGALTDETELQAGGALAESGGLGYLRLRVAQYAFLFVSTLLVTRILGPTGRAQYALPLALAGAIWVVTNLTLEISAARLLARRDASVERLVASLSLCLLLLSSVGVSLTLAIGLTERDVLLADASGTMVVLAALTIPFLLMYQFAGQILVVLGKLREQGIATAMGGAIQLVMVLVLAIADRITPTSALAAALVGFASTGLLVTLMLARELGARALFPTIDQKTLRPLVRSGLILHPGSVALQLDPRLSLILVGAFLSSHATGLYSLSLTLASSVLLASQALTISAVHKQYAEDERRAADFTLAFTRQSFLIMVGVALVIAPLAYPFVVLVYGGAFAGGTAPFIVLLVVAIAFAVEAPCRVLLVRIAPPLTVTSIVCASILVNAGLTIALIQVLSITGAALAAVASYWMLAMIMLHVVTSRTGHSPREVFKWPRQDDEAIRLLRTAVARLRPNAARAP